MDKDFTQLSIAELAAVVKKAMHNEKMVEPKEL